MRTFIAIELSHEIKSEIHKLQNRLKVYQKRGRWKNCENSHLTIKFLGEIDGDKKLEIDKAMKEIAFRTRSFEFKLGGVGQFGRRRRTVLWIGICGESAELTSLQRKIDTALAELGFSVEARGFKPHITLGKNIVFEASLEDIAKRVSRHKFKPVYVDRICLFRSRQIDNKIEYDAISEYKFKRERRKRKG